MPLRTAVYWMIFSGLSFLVVSPIIRVLRRTGYSEWWALLALVPVVNLAALWWFAYARWPRLAAVRPSTPGS